MYADRVALYREIEKARGSRVVAYITGDRRQLETKISSEVVDLFVDHLDQIGVVPKISLFLYTRGGDTLGAWSLTNLLRSFCDHFEVIVPAKAHSAGTLISLAADSIVMTKQAALGPIDPSVNTPLNPQLAGGQPMAKVPVSVEDVNGFLEFARKALGETGDVSTAFDRLAQSVHPIVLGNAYRARSQIRMLGRRLLATHMQDEQAVDKILGFLCSDSGSHDYTINRREARGELGLPVETPSQELYELIKKTYDDVASELELAIPYDHNLLLAGGNSVNYSLPRALVESASAGSHVFLSEGRLTRQQIQLQPGIMGDAINDQRQFEGWRHRNA
jgi:hypothetical protein